MIGRLIVFEGIDGVGKTSMFDRTISHLQMKLGPENVEQSKDLGGSLLGEELRRIIYGPVPPKDLAHGVIDLLFLAGHIQNWLTRVQPWLREGKTVVSDRWWLSQFAYTVARDFDTDVQDLYFKKKGDWPGLTIFLYGDPGTVLARANSRVDSETHQYKKVWNDPGKQQRVLDKYFELYKDKPGFYPVRVDGRTEEKVWTIVKYAVDQYIGMKP